MCGRYSLRQHPREILRELGISRQDDFEFRERYNIAPTQLAPVIVGEEDGLRIRPMRWGLIPSWSKDESMAAKCINARIETVKEKPSFRSALKKRRCLVPATDFYEWLRREDSKQPFRFQVWQAKLFCMAGIWEKWINPEGAVVDSFSIITQPAMMPVSLIHDRMPKILQQDQYKIWLDEEHYEEVLPYFELAEKMNMEAVSKRMNSSRNEGPDCCVRLFQLGRSKSFKKGDLVTAKSMRSAYHLPQGLPENSTVKVDGFDVGTVIVEWEGKTFRVPIGCIDSGNEIQVEGRWIDENDSSIKEPLNLENECRRWRFPELY